ncbi:Chloroperoxidase [Diplogelasinospora grovesii]|uniref:Chloroperoxidase n=1 Tax=Diplogelasinospora grovesii TaxID=303347 RepID=A0AAN6S3X4_9PEZI|nr:Chloroperoxidase [Diplogelasinospora grovesii]
MKLSLFVKTGLFGLAAGSGDWEPKGHEWHPPLPEDSRSPCPGLNAMANHGWLPRSGKNIDLAAVRFGVTGAYNYAPTTFDDAFAQAVSFNLTTTGNGSTFHLADLAKHDDIEFDGSLSRNDFYFGDNLHFDPAIFATVAERLGLYEAGDSEMDKYVTVETAAKARAARVQDAMRVNPTFNASANEMSGSPGTTALYLVTLWDDKVGAVPKAWIRSFFEKERIPYLEGYKLPETQKTSATITDMFERVLAAKV